MTTRTASFYGRRRIARKRTYNQAISTRREQERAIYYAMPSTRYGRAQEHDFTEAHFYRDFDRGGHGCE